MPSHNQPRIILVTLCVVTLVGVNAFMFRGVLGHWIADGAGRVLAPMAQRIGYGQALVQVLLGRHEIVDENLKLKEELERAHAVAARVDELEHENQFLRTAAGLGERTGRDVIQAGAFAYVREGGVRELIINKGSQNSIEIGDIVITEGGSLVGAVIRVFPRHSVVRAVGDPALEITARVAGTQISGLLQVDARQGLSLSLVQKGEVVTEGQTIITSGNDQFPGGLLIGTVRSVDNSSATLFQIIRVSAAVPQSLARYVLVIRR